MLELDRKSEALSPPSHLYWLHFRTLEPFILEQLKYAEAPLLDLGCGARPYKAYAPAGESVGADVVPAANGAVDVLITPGEPLPFPDNRFATILCTQVMEHVEDPYWLINESFRVLRPGGRLILTVPFVWELHERPHDYLRFSEYWLAHNFKKAGFQIWEFDRQGGDIATVGQIICLMLAVRQIHMPKWMQKMYNKFFAYLDRKSNTTCMPLNYGIVCLKQAVSQKGGGLIMHIGIFAERFVGRYGADRVLVIMAEQLQAAGHQVTLVGVRFSRPVVDRFAGHTFRVPDFAGKEPEARTLAWFKDKDYFLRRKLPAFDLCIVGSYPFISAIPHLAASSGGVMFVDFGVVPTHGYPPDVTALIEGVRANRQATLEHCQSILAISDYLAREQARPDCKDRVPVRTVLLGADHLAEGFGTTQDDGPAQPRKRGPRRKSQTQQILDSLMEDRRRLVFCLGRWEPGCYKNSQAAFDVMRTVAELDPEAALLVLANPYQFVAPPGLERNAYAIGLPSDEDMEQVTRVIDAGISVSLWEGFNLPLAELQYREKPVFAFDLAAHPEVVVSRDQLCAGTEEMALKVYEALRQDGPPAWARPAGDAPAPVAAWREKFSWRRFQTEFLGMVERAA